MQPTFQGEVKVEATYQRPLGAAACYAWFLLTRVSSDDVIAFEGHLRQNRAGFCDFPAAVKGLARTASTVTGKWPATNAPEITTSL